MLCLSCRGSARHLDCSGTTAKMPRGSALGRPTVTLRLGEGGPVSAPGDASPSLSMTVETISVKLRLAGHIQPPKDIASRREPGYSSRTSLADQLFQAVDVARQDAEGLLDRGRRGQVNTGQLEGV